MRHLTIKIFILLFLLSCSKGIQERNKFLGNWEMTEYNVDDIFIDEKEAFTSTKIEIKPPQSYSSLSFLVFRNENPCNHIYPISCTYNESEVNFGEFSVCDTLNKIDPYFYKTEDTSHNNISGRWEIEYHNKRMLIINNKNQSRIETVRIIFEKIK